MDAISIRRWVPRGAEGPFDAVAALAASLGIAPLTARTLIERGVCDPDAAKAFLESRLASLPDPFLLQGMEAAVARLAGAVMQAEPIAVHGDYDVDGITGTALLVEVLRGCGAQVSSHIPLRLRDGYGLCGSALEAAAASGAKVAISVDCGVCAVEEARLAERLGLDLIITDHHQPPAELPRAHAIVNPHLPGDAFPFKDLAGVGVAFMVLVGLRKRLRERGWFEARQEPDLRHALDLVALGTIADVVPLIGVNRLLTRTGLAVMERGGRPGLQALKTVAEVKEVNCGNVAFRLAPRLNAAGRLEDAAQGVDLLLEDDIGRASEVAAGLDGLNRERQEIEKRALEQAIERLENGEGGKRSIVLADERWHSGVIGIVASRLVERYHRPTVLIALDGGRGKGSARSIGGFHLYRAFERCRGHLVQFGGHEYAAGLSIEAGQVDGFARALEEVAAEILTEEDLVPRLGYDQEVLLEELTEAAVGELERLAPFGAGNPEPAFVVRQVRIHWPSVVGKDHLRFTARQGGDSLPCIAFGMAERRDELEGDVDILFSAGINRWQGRTTVQLRVKDFRPSGAEDQC